MPYYAMELVLGGSLAHQLKGIPLQSDSAARLIVELAQALHAAHESGIVHRDLKPANVLLEPALPGQGIEFQSELGDARRFEPKIADFGLAKRLGDSTLHTATGELLGTPSYMAPEQAVGNHADIGPRTDVYALGVILYETLTGHPPFRATTSLETLRHVTQDEPVPLRRLQPAVPRDLETICLKCLEKNPARRFTSAAELANDVQRFLDGRPIHARRAGSIERAAKWSRRNPAWAVAVGVATAAAIGILAATARHNRLLQAEVMRANASTAEAQRKRSQTLANFNKTQETLLGILTRLWQESQLSDDATQKKLRENLLQTMLQYYDAVPMDESESDADSLLTNALATFHAAHVHHYLEEYAEAESRFRSALPTFEESATAYPDNTTYRRWWALCCLRLGAALVESHDPQQAIQWLRQALAILAQAPSEDPGLLGLEARCRLDVARLCATPKDIDEAISQAEKAAMLGRSILSAEPNNDENRWKICVALNLLSRLLSSDGRVREAGVLVAECAATSASWQGEADSYYVFNSRVDLADSLRVLALGIADDERYDEALAHFQSAIGLLDEVHKKKPHYVKARSVAHGVYWTRAMVYARMGLHELALEDWDRCVEVSEGDLRDIARFGRAKARLNMRDFEQAAADADELLETRDLRPEMLFDLALLYCKCAELAGPRNSLDAKPRHGGGHEFAARAVQCLVQCNAAGLFSAPSRLHDLETMPMLSILRERSDFQKLLDEVTVASID
jgi:tetratricopeptide (TPR) repeat protein